MSLHDNYRNVDVVAPLRAVANDVEAVALVEANGVGGGLDPHRTFVSTCVAERSG
jgi:hypothetical protein